MVVVASTSDAAYDFCGISKEGLKRNPFGYGVVFVFHGISKEGLKRVQRKLKVYKRYRLSAESQKKD